MSTQLAVVCDRCRTAETMKMRLDPDDLPKGWRRLTWSRNDTTFGDGEFDLCPRCVEHITHALWPLSTVSP